MCSACQVGETYILPATIHTPFHPAEGDLSANKIPLRKWRSMSRDTQIADPLETDGAAQLQAMT